ncbi:MAG TPA: hypothetical protein PKX72_03320 [Chitinophagales bacterium]|nr:hypothetical protein [Chitinophagales bacterium]HQO88930.1 hypothetical protein [Chitinophagales bacterium]
MKKFIFTLLLFAFAIVTHARPGVFVKVRPAAPKVVVVKPKSPGNQYVWVSGDWIWHPKKQQYIWVDGKWLLPPKAAVWVDGHWKATSGGWYWVSGHWKKI